MHYGVWFPLGLGVTTVATFLVSWLGLPLNSQVIGALLVVLLVTSLVLALHGKRANGKESSDDYLPRWAGAILLMVFIVAGLLAVGRSYSTWDAMSAYSVQGYAIAHYESIGVANDWGSGSGYPLNIPIAISIFEILGGDPGPLSKLLFTLFYASAIIGMIQFWIRNDVAKPYAAVGGLLFATIPVVFEHGTIGYVNLPFACYLTLGILQIVDGAHHESIRQQLLGGILLALATWTRPDGLPIVLSALFGLWVAASYTRVRNLSLWAMVIPVVVLSGLWQFYSWAVSPAGAQSSIVSSIEIAAGDLRQGTLNLDAFYWIGRFAGGQLKEPSIWGLLLPVSLLTLFANRKIILSRELQASFLLLMAMLMVGISLLLFYYLIAFQGNLTYWLGTDVSRMLLPVAMLGWAWLILLWAKLPDSGPQSTESAK